MNFPSRRTPLALSFYCGFVGVVLGVCHADAQEPALPPLRVDPALLGQPALKPAAAIVPVGAAGMLALIGIFDFIGTIGAGNEQQRKVGQWHEDDQRLG